MGQQWVVGAPSPTSSDALLKKSCESFSGALAASAHVAHLNSDSLEPVPHSFDTRRLKQREQPG